MFVLKVLSLGCRITHVCVFFHSPIPFAQSTLSVKYCRHGLLISLLIKLSTSFGSGINVNLYESQCLGKSLSRRKCIAHQHRCGQFDKTCSKMTSCFFFQLRRKIQQGSVSFSAYCLYVYSTLISSNCACGVKQGRTFREVNNTSYLQTTRET